MIKMKIHETRLLLNLQRIALGIMVILPFGYSLGVQVMALIRSFDPLAAMHAVPFLIVLLLFLASLFSTREQSPSTRLILTAMALVAWGSLELIEIVPAYALWFLPAGAVFIALLVAAFRPNFGKANTLLSVLLVIFLAVGLRAAILVIVSTDLQSDILDTHLFALDVLAGEFPVGKYTFIPAALHLDVTGLVFAGVYRLFGPGIKTLKALMIVLSALSTWLVYLAGKDASGDRRVGLAAAICFAIYPVMIVYTGVPTDEHLAMPLIIGLISLRVRGPSIRAFGRLADLVTYALLGLGVGVMDWFRPVGIVMMLALLISDLIYHAPQVKWLRQALGLVISLAAFYAASNAALPVVENLFGMKLPPGSQLISHTILVGLNPEYQGAHNLEDYVIIQKAHELYPDDTGEATHYLIRFALSRLKPADLPGLFSAKLEHVWADDGQMFELALFGSDDQQLIDYLSQLNAGFYFLLSALALAGIAISFREKPSRELFMMQLFITGMALLLLIAEAQTRYRIILLPYLVIMAMIGLKQVLTRAGARGGRT